MRSSRKLVAGLLDAALAALGTFLAGIVAVRELNTATLSVYAVVFSASVFAMLLPRQLHYIPSQLGANLESDLRSPLIRHDVRRASRVNIVTLAVVLAASLSVTAVSPVGTCLMLGATAALFSVVSPVQDHIRAALHLVDRHMSAAACSATLAGVVAVGTAVGLSNRGAPWLPLVPFGALLLGNAISLAVGVLLLRGAPRHVGYMPQPAKDRGRLLLSELVVQGAWFACNYLVLFLLGAAFLARLEAARIVASPITILTTALITFMGPAVLRALRPSAANPHGPRNHILFFVAVLAAGAAAYGALLAVAGPLIATVLDKPFSLPLVITRIAAYVVEGVSGILNLIVYTIGRTGLALVYSIVAGVIGLAGTVALVGPIGVFALPAAQALGMSVRLAAAGATTARATSRSAEGLTRTAP